jgi:hypothetical protein
MEGTWKKSRATTTVRKIKILPAGNIGNYANACKKWKIQPKFYDQVYIEWKA